MKCLSFLKEGDQLRGQWGLILGIIAALVIAIFAVINVEPVRVNYLFGVSEWPLILVIIGSVLMGGILVGAVGMVKVYRLQNEIKRIKQKESIREGQLNDDSKELKPEELNKKTDDNSSGK